MRAGVDGSFTIVHNCLKTKKTHQSVEENKGTINDGMRKDKIANFKVL